MSETKNTDTRDSIMGMLLLGFGLWWCFGSGESDAEKQKRAAKEKAEIAALAALPEGERIPKVIKSIFEGDEVEVTLGPRDIRISKTVKSLLDDWVIFNEVQNDAAQLVKGIRKYGLPVDGKTIRISMGAKTVDKYGNPSGASTATTVSWDGADLIKVSDENALVYVMTWLVRSMSNPSVGRVRLVTALRALFIRPQSAFVEWP